MNQTVPRFAFAADLKRDALYGARVLLKSPGFTAITLLVFAIGIGAATAIVSVADALMMRPIPVAHPERVMTLWQSNRETGADRLDVAPGNAIDWMARTRSFELLSAAEPFTFNLNFAGREPDYVYGARVTEQFFAVLRTPPLLGRTFSSQEHSRGGPRVVILSHPFWTTRFGADRSIVGTRIRLDAGDPYTVVGVMPRRLELRLFEDRTKVPETQVWIPKRGFEAFERNLRVYGAYTLVGRLRADLSVAQAQAELDAISAQLAREYPQTNAQIAAQVVPLRDHLVGSLGPVLPFLLGAAAILLVVACANVANLLLARGASRGREFAVRHAIGASRARLVRQMLVETVMLALAGGVAGLALSRWTLDVIAPLRPRDIALVDHIPIDARSAAIALGVTIAAAIIAGLTPSMQLSRPAAVNALRAGRASARLGIRSALIVMEVAAAVVVVVGAGLLVRSFILIQHVDPGFSRDNISVLQVFASSRIQTPTKRVLFCQQVLERLRSVPGVAAAGAVTSLPFGEAKVIIRGPLAISGRGAEPGDEAFTELTAVAGDYFKAMGVPLLSGRIFDGTETATSRQVAVVSQRAAQQFWRGADPRGSKVRFKLAEQAFDAEVIGVVGDVRHEALDAPAAAEVFVPYAQSGFRALSFVVRTTPGSAVSLDALKEQIWAVDPAQTIFNAARVDQLIAKTLSTKRFNLLVLGGFAIATLCMAVAGVYGVMSFSTSQRAREFGVRVALGATPGAILRLVLREGLMLAGYGVIAGIVVAMPVTQLLRALLFGVTTTDAATFLTVGAALILSAAAACYLPARRALNVDPAHALRVE